MNHSFKILFDTNIIIQLEDNITISENLKRLIEYINTNNLKVYIHEISHIEFARDSNQERQAISKSKLSKYNQIKLTSLSKDVLEEKFGEIKNDNDLADCQLLASLALNAVNILITEDRRLLKRALRAGLDERIYNIQSATSFLDREYSKTTEYIYPTVEKKISYQLNPQDEIFNSLRADYPDFDHWWNKCCHEGRECWVIMNGDKISSLIVFKLEEEPEMIKKFNMKKILKICTFKVSETARGQRHGEQMLKQCFQYCFDNNFDCLYLTTFEKHEDLVFLCSKFGFQDAGCNERDEIFKLKKLTPNAEDLKNFEELDFHRKYWPKLLITEKTKIFLIPIRPEFHSRLFPEWRNQPWQAQLKLPELLQKKIHDQQNNNPGNSITKVYVCSCSTREIEPGSLLLFYCSESIKAITSVGVAERFDAITDINKAMELTGKRTVYSAADLELYLNHSKNGLKIINFSFAFHFDKPISYNSLKKSQIIKGPIHSKNKLR
ncbi:MAG: GNAT family N-acetyltransferase [bacterium]